MTDQTVTLRITGENGQLVGVIRASKAELGGLGKSAGDAGAKAAAGARGVDALGASSERTRQRVRLLSGSLGQLQGLLGAALLVKTVRDLGRTADAYSDIDGKLKQVTHSERELATAKAATFAISQKYYQEFEATVTLYSRGAQALAQYNVGQAKVAELTETINAGLLVSRATAAESASAILQLSQALGAGALRGEEFNAVNEAAPRLMQALADSIGVPRGELRALAQDGKLTVDVLLDAWTGPQAARIAEEASKVPLTIGRAWQQLRNEVLKGLGEIDQTAGSSSAVAAAIQGIGASLGVLGRVAAATALVFAGRLVSALASAATQFLATQAASTRAYVSMMRLNTGMSASRAIAGRLGTGVASLGRGMVAFAGGPIGIVVIALGALVAKFMSAAAAARQLKQDTADAIESSNAFLDSNDLRMAEASGKSLFANREDLKTKLAEAKRLQEYYQGLGAAGSKFAAKFANEGRELQAQLDGVNHSLDLNAKRIYEVSARQAEASQATGAATRENKAFNESLAEQNEKLKVDRIEREQGLRAALEYQAMQAAGVTSVSQLTQATRDLIETQVRETSAADAYKAAQQATAKGAKAAAKATDEQRRAQLEYADELEHTRAELEGPLRVAQVEHDQRIRQLTVDLAANNITQAAFNGLKDVEDAKLQRTTEKLARQSDILGQIRADYDQQIYLSTLSGDALRVEEEVIRRRNDALQSGLEVTAEMEAAWRDAIAVGEHQLSIADAAHRAADEYRSSWLNAVDSVSRAFGDFVVSGLRRWKSFGDALKDIAKRWVSDLVAQFSRNGGLSEAIRRMFSGGFADAGGAAGGGGFWSSLLGGGSGGGGGFLSSVGSAIGRMFGFGGAQAAGATGGGWVTAASSLLGGAGSLSAGGNVFTAGGAAAATGGGSGSLLSSGASLLSKPGTIGKFLQSPTAPWLGAIAGGVWGYNQGGDTTGKVLGTAAGAAAGYGLTAAAGAGLAAYGAGATLGGAATAGLAAIPVVGWIALAAIAVNAISGGKLFGTKYKMDSATNDYSYGDAGFGGSQSILKVKQRSLFGGRKWTTETSGLSADAQKALDDVFDAIDSAVVEAAGRLGVSAPELLAASFRQEFDKKGNLTREFGTIAGRVYNEAQDVFNKRYLAENLLAVAGQVGHAGEIDTLANTYRGNADALNDYATLILAMQDDAQKARALWDDADGAITRVVGVIERLKQGGEQLAQTYARVSQAAHAYGDFIGGVYQEVALAGLNQYQRAQLDVELQYRSQVKQANELAKALGLSGARSEDLAKIEELRAMRMADLQKQMESQKDTFLADLGLSDLSPLGDKDKLASSMQQLRDAVDGGDLQRAQQLAQQALGFGRNLYASGGDYNALYGQVTSMLDGIGMNAEAGFSQTELQRIADTMDSLPEDIARAMFDLLAAQAPAPTDTTTLPPPPTGTPTDGTGGGTGTGTGGAGGTGTGRVTDPYALDLLASIATNTAETLRVLRSNELKAGNV